MVTRADMYELLQQRERELTHIEIAADAESVIIEGVEYNVVRTDDDFISINNALGSNYILANDINFEKVTKPIGYGVASVPGKLVSFSGIFDGNNYRMKNLKLIVGKEDVPLQQLYKHGTALFNRSTGTIRNLIVDKSSEIVNNYHPLAVAAIVSFNMGVVENCINYVDLRGSRCVGGIVAKNGSELLSSEYDEYREDGWVVNNCINYGEIKGDDAYIGGIIGDMGSHKDSRTSNCYNFGDVSALGSVCGGIAGSGERVTDSKNYGNVTGSINIGGIVGAGVAEGCQNLGETVSGVSYVGGIVGGGNAYNSINYGKINARQHDVGGVVGLLSSTVKTARTMGKCGVNAVWAA